MGRSTAPTWYEMRTNLCAPWGRVTAPTWFYFFLNFFIRVGAVDRPHATLPWGRVTGPTWFYFFKKVFYSRWGGCDRSNAPCQWNLFFKFFFMLRWGGYYFCDRRNEWTTKKKISPRNSPSDGLDRRNAFSWGRFLANHQNACAANRRFFCSVYLGTEGVSSCFRLIYEWIVKKELV